MIKTEDLETIVQYAESIQINNTVTHSNLLDVYEGNLKEHIEASMSIEFNPNAFQAARQRIIPINVLKRTTDKLAKVYSQGVERSSADDTDNNLVTEYETVLDLDNLMSKSDSMLNLLRSCAFEPYVRDGKPQLRVLTPDQFTVWSDDVHDKTKPTVFIKFMGSKTTSEIVDENTIETRVNIYVLYDKDEFITIHSDMHIVNRKLHDFNRIPFTYMNLSISKLVPKPDEDSYAVAILIPKLLSDLNYASKYLSHGIRYGIDVDISNLEGNPDAFWSVKSMETENAKPEIGVLAPSVDIDKVINLTKEELIMYLESRSLKVDGSGKVQASGFAKLIDSADVTDVRKENMKLFKSAEQDLWLLISIMHNIWVANEELDSPELSGSFSKDFEISIKYGDMTPIVDPGEKRDNLQFKIDNKLTTRERAIREANPDLTTSEQDILIEELAVEAKKDESNNENDKDSSVGSGVQDPDNEGSKG
jgi:hypothetical protein